MQKSYLALGCFWKPEETFRQISGILETEVGYAGGKNNITNYEEVCTGKTGHTETIKLTFDEKIISYEKILEVFFKIHDPTQKDMQYPDVGTQYRSEIFYENENQKKIAKKYKEIFNKQFNGKIETNIGGVAANVAVALSNHYKKNTNFEIILLSSTGNDKKSDLLLSILSKHNKINCKNVIREKGTSDGYVGLEFKGELFGAIASSDQLEKSCTKIFEPFVRLIRSEKNLPFENFLIVDSNLTNKAIDHLTFDPIFDQTNFIIACASPYKAKKIRNL